MIYFASDHGGFELKEHLKSFLMKDGQVIEDLGPTSDSSVDYPDYAKLLTDAVLRQEDGRGILLCGSGIGMSIAANRVPGIRAALVHDILTARLSRQHNDANVLVLGGRLLGKDLAVEIVKTWLATPFEGGRHERRLAKIS